MTRTWLSIVTVAGIIGLLTLFLGLQYKWLSEISDAERERTQRRVESDASRFAEDFNREMHAAYYNFQTDAAAWKNSDWNEFNERYDFWKSRTEYPGLIRAIYFLPKQQELQPLRYDPEKRIFDTAESSPEITDLRPRLSTDSYKAVYDDQLAMVLPIYESEKEMKHLVLRRSATPDSPPGMFRMPDNFGWVVVLLDEAVIKGRVLPDLEREYFGDDYKVAIADKRGETIFADGGEVTSSDATSPMFNMSPDKLLFFANRDVLPKIVREHKSGRIINQRVESHTFSRTEIDGKKGTFQLEVKQGTGGPSTQRAAVMSTSSDAAPDPWVLHVQHTAGSIDAFATAERNKSFAIGLGIYLLLVGGILAIVLSALRSRRFAQRQIDFVSSVSHEFRTPLAVIYSAGENLADGVAKEDAQVSRYGELIKGEGRKLSAMVEQILEFAGANSGKQKYNFGAANVADIVNDAVEECRPLIESGGFTLETDVPDDLPAIRADRGALSSAIQNLIANAVKYSNGSKWVRVTAWNGDASVKIAVEDRGIGIRGEDLKRIFEPFFRGKEVVDGQISGNGLGLNLVKKILDAHQGRVAVESKPGIGSKFTIELPQLD